MNTNKDVVDNPGWPPAAAPESRAPLLLGVNTGLMTLATIFIFLRFYTRYVVLNRLGYDDWLALLALIFVLATGVTQCWRFFHSDAAWVRTPHRHISPARRAQDYTQHLWFSVLWYNTAVMATKLALLAQYYRVLPVQTVRRACVALQVVIGLWGLVQVMLSIFTCFPIQAYWDKDLALGGSNPAAKGAETTTTVRCIQPLPLAYQNAAGNIATYVAVLALPLPALSNVHLPRAQKCLLIGIFCLGFFTCGVAAIRIMYFREYSDPTWESVDPAILSLTELCSGTICLCLPTLRPLVARWLPASLNSTAASATSKGGNRSTANRSPVDNNHGGGGGGGGDLEKASLGLPKRPPPAPIQAAVAVLARRPSASLQRPSASGSDSDFIYGLETARKAVPAQTPSPEPLPVCVPIIRRPLKLGGGGGSGGGSNSSRRSSTTAETSSVVRFAAMPAAPLSSFSAQQKQKQQGNYYYAHRNNSSHPGNNYLRGQSSSNWLLESRVSTEIGTSSSPVPSEERRTLGSAAIRVKRMVTKRESVVAGW
ncbi:hypothetical protein PG994_002639 [Apiospora phragmitis]|uniref:Rhodopsin domain-containing protein n=1 Tax=Apiospora phragmitis TaxID=2905665 RepID=A0ABR1W6Z3_9PEZI